MEKITLLPCPFCGLNPETDTKGSCIDISCCAFIGIQKADYLSVEDRKQWDTEKITYPEDIETRLFNFIARDWNMRFGEPEKK